MVSAFAAIAMLTGPSADACGRFLLKPDGAEHAVMAAAVGKAALASTTASAIDAAVGAGEWRVVWARPADREPGVFVFRRTAPAAPLRFVDVWGGVAGTDGPGVVSAWTRKLHMPRELAACVADRVFTQGP